VEHRRTAWLRPGGYVVIRDELTGAPGSRIDATFQFAPGNLAVSASSALFDGRYELTWLCSAPTQARSISGGTNPSDGWIATSLGVRVAAPRLSVTFAMDQPRVALLTILADRESTRSRAGARVSSQPGSGGRLLRAWVKGAGWTDDVIAATAGDASTGGVQTDAPLVIVRRTAGREAHAIPAGGTYATVAATELTDARPDPAAAVVSAARVLA
jgi:hypothetical protein